LAVSIAIPKILISHWPIFVSIVTIKLIICLRLRRHSSRLYNICSILILV